MQPGNLKLGLTADVALAYGCCFHIIFCMHSRLFSIFFRGSLAHQLGRENAKERPRRKLNFRLTTPSPLGSSVFNSFRLPRHFPLFPVLFVVCCSHLLCCFAAIVLTTCSSPPTHHSIFRTRQRVSFQFNFPLEMRSRSQASVAFAICGYTFNCEAIFIIIIICRSLCCIALFFFWRKKRRH